MNGYHGYNFNIRIPDPKIGSKLLNRSLGFFGIIVCNRNSQRVIELLLSCRTRAHHQDRTGGMRRDVFADAFMSHVVVWRFAFGADDDQVCVDLFGGGSDAVPNMTVSSDMSKMSLRAFEYFDHRCKSVFIVLDGIGHKLRNGMASGVC